MSNSYDKVQTIEIDADEAGQRIDNFLVKKLKGVPKSRVYRILRKGEVRVNKKRIKPEYKIQAADLIRIPPIRVSEETNTVSKHLDKVAKLEQQIIYEDDSMLIVNKPSGLAVHGGSGLQFGLIEALRALRPGSKFLELVHRIDRDTSGILMVAKKRSALRELHRQLREKEIQKDYLTLVHGQWPVQLKMSKAPLRKNALSSGERIVIVDVHEGKPSKTRFIVQQQFAEATLLKASPVTGRTHQIRVHCQHEGHSIYGDDKYSNAEELEAAKDLNLSRLFLHAWRIRFTHPNNGKEMSLEAPLAPELQKVSDSLTPL